MLSAVAARGATRRVSWEGSVIDSRLSQIRRLAAEADRITVEIRDETECDTPEGRGMDIVHSYLQLAIARTTAVEEL